MADQELPGGWRIRGGVLIPPDFQNQGAMPPPDQLGPLRAARDLRTPSYAPQGPPAPPPPPEPMPFAPSTPPLQSMAPKMGLEDPVSPPKDVLPRDQQDAFEEMQRLMNIEVGPGKAGPAPEPEDDTQGRIAGLESIRSKLGLARVLGQGGNTIARGFMSLGRVPQNVTSGNDLGGIDQAEGQLNRDVAQLRGQIPQGLRQRLGIGDQKLPGGLTYEQFSKIQPTLVAGENRKAADSRLRETEGDRENKEVRGTLQKAYDTFDQRTAKLKQEVQDTQKAEKLLSGPDVGPQALQLAARSIIRAVESGRLTDRDVDAVAKLPGVYERLKSFVQTGVGGEVNPDIVAGLKKLALDQGKTVRDLYEREKEDAALRVKNSLNARGGLKVPDDVIMQQFGLK